MARFRSARVAALLDKIAVEHQPGLTNAQLMLENEDLKPVEPARRQWGWINYVCFWIADSFNINTWMIASSSIENGLGWWEAWITVWVGYTLAAIFVILTGRIGAKYHISFPVACRGSFGIWGSLWPVLNRVVMACIWYGVQSYIGGECVQLMIQAIWPSWAQYGEGQPKNTISASGTSTEGFVSFFLFWLGSLPFLYFSVQKIRHLFTVKAYFVPAAGIAFFIWAIVRAGGLGPIIHQRSTLTGSAYAWAIISGIMTSIANFAALIMNNPDFSRFSRRPVDAVWSQLITIPVGFAITSFIGIICSSAAGVIFGQVVWSPLTLLQDFLEEPGVTSATRFGVFVIALAFTLAQLGTNIAANSVSAGTDMTALLPRYLNIRRGSYICAAIGLAMCPWTLVASSSTFTTYLSAYSVFLSSIAGVIIADYYVVRKGFLQVRDLYSALRSGPYYYTYGCNWRAYAAYIAGILINVVGFAGAVGATVPIGATYIYNFNYIAGFLVAFAVYWLICYFFPVPATSDHWLEVDDDAVNGAAILPDDDLSATEAGFKHAGSASASDAGSATVVYGFAATPTSSNNDQKSPTDVHVQSFHPKADTPAHEPKSDFY